MDAIEFTDRYGGQPPSLITGCHRCEAMGVTPVPDAGDPDGWAFVRCPACRGTGRVPLWRGVWRLPRLWWRGCSFVRSSWHFWDGVPTAHDSALTRTMRRSRWHRLLFLARIAFVNDLARLRGARG